MCQRVRLNCHTISTVHTKIHHSHSFLPVSIEICKLTLDYLNNGPNPKKYELAATKYSTTPTILENAIKALVMLVINAAKNDVSHDNNAAIDLLLSLKHPDLLLRRCLKRTLPMQTQIRASMLSKYPFCGNLLRINAAQ